MGGDTIQASSQDGRYSLAKMEPDKREAILKSLSTGLGVVKTAQTHRVSAHTVESVRDAELRDNPAFASTYYQTRMGAKLLHLASKGIDRMDERMEQMPMGVLPIMVGVAIDKFLALSGQASQVIEHRHSVSLDAAADPFKAGAIDV